MSSEHFFCQFHSQSKAAVQLPGRTHHLQIEEHVCDVQIKIIRPPGLLRQLSGKNDRLYIIVTLTVESVDVLEVSGFYTLSSTFSAFPWGEKVGMEVRSL